VATHGLVVVVAAVLHMTKVDPLSVFPITLAIVVIKKPQEVILLPKVM
jgi:hypothetical protein